MKIQTSRHFIARLASRRFARVLMASCTAGLAAMVLLTTSSAFADVIKADNNIQLNLAGSYTPSGLPTTTDRIIFDNTIATPANSGVSLGGDLSIAGIVFGTTTALTSNGNATTTYNINNTVGATLTLGASGISLTSTVNNLALNNVLRLGSSQIWDVVSGRTLSTVGSSGSTIDLGANALTVQGAGATMLSSLIYGSGSITKAGTGTLTLNSTTGSNNTNNGGSLFSGGINVGTGGTVTISTANTSGTGLITSSGTLNISQAQLLLSGGITVNAGTTTLSNGNTAGTGTVTLNGGTLALTSSTATQLNSVVLNSGTFAPANAVTFGSLAGTQGFTATANALSFGTNNTNSTYSGNIAGAVGANVTKTGSGTQILNGTVATTGTITANGSGGTLEIGGQFNASGAVTVNAGTLRLNFGTNNTVASNLIGAGALTVGGGTLDVRGQTGATNVIQNFSGTTFNTGTASTISVTNGAGGGTTAVNLAGLTRNAGSAINFVLPSGTQSATNGIQATSGSAGLLVPTNNTAYATVGGTDFAAKDASNAFIVPLTGTVAATGGTSLTGTATDNANVNTATVSTSAASTINTVRFNNAGGSTLTLGGALTVTDGGILVSSAVTGAGSKITGTSITAAGTAELIVHQFSAQPFTLDSQVTGSILLTKSGPGTLVVTKANTNNTGNFAAYVGSGTLQIGPGGSFANGNVNLAPNDPTAVFDVNNQTTTVSYIAGGNTTGGYITLGNSGTLNLVTASGASSNFSGAIFGGVGSVINKGATTTGNAAYQQGFQGQNQGFFGTININAGQLGVFGGSLINATVNVNTGTNSALSTGGNSATVVLGNLGGTGGSVLGSTAASVVETFNIGYLGGTSSYAGSIQNGTNATPGVSNVGKYGSGTTTLSGNNTYTGATQINSGGLIFDYSTGSTTPLATGSAITVGGGTATFRGLAAGGTTATTGTFGFNNSVLSKVVLDSNGAAGGITANLKTTTVNGIATLASNSVNNSVLFDTSSTANNLLRTDVAIGAAGFTAADTVAIRTNNGILTTGATSTIGYRANVLIRDSVGVGFATTSGTSIVRYTGATPLTAADSATTLSETGTGNYILSVNLTRGAGNQFLYNTIQLDSSSQAVTLTTDSNGNRFGGGGGSTTSGRGVLATGINGATITSPGGTNQATYFNNYQTGATTAGQTLTLNLNLGGVSYFNGTGLTIATAAVNSNDQNFQSGVIRLTGTQNSGDALTGGNGVYRLIGGVLEIGADLTGTTSSTSTADFSRSVGTGGAQVQLLGDTGFSAFGGNRTVNLGGAGQSLVWGNDNFLASTVGGTTEGNNSFRLSSVYSDSTVDFQNGIVLGLVTRNVDVANGSAAVDARLSGVISGVFAPTVTLANGAPNVVLGVAGLNKQGAGTLDLTAANTFSGQTTVVAGALELSNALALQNSNLAPLTNGVIFNSSVSGNAFTVGGLTGAATNNDLVLQNNAATPAAIALTVGNNNSSPVYAGVLSGAGSLTKIGAGTQTLSGTNTYTGTTTVSAGTLQIGNGGTSGQFGVGGAVINNGAVVFNRTDSMTMVSNAISGAGTLTQAGTGITGLTNNNTYSGATNVNAGTLLINNTPVSGVDSGTGTGLVTVNNGGTLGGAGAIAGATTVNGGGQITGGTVGSVGTLTLRNNLTFSGATGSLATFLVDIGSGTNNSDTLAVGGVLDLSGTFDRITFAGTPDGTSSYVLANYSSVSGVFDNGTAPAGYGLVYNGTELDLVPVPEPATVFGGLLMVGSLGFTQRRRVRGLVGAVQGMFQAA